MINYQRRKSLKLLDTLSLQKNYLLRTIIKCNNIFDTNILSRGHPTKLKIYGNSRGWGGGYDKHPLQCIMEIPAGVRGYDKHTLQHTIEIPGGWGGGGSKVNVPFVGGMDIFWKYTIINKMCFLQGSWQLIFNLYGNFYFSFLFELYQQTLPCPKRKESQKLPEIKN